MRKTKCIKDDAGAINKLKHTKKKFVSLEVRHFPHLFTHELLFFSLKVLFFGVKRNNNITLQKVTLECAKQNVSRTRLEQSTN